MSNQASSSYSITKLDSSDNSIEADVRIDDSHELFSGHFPGNPIVPGVLNIEIIQTIVKAALGDYSIAKINQLKFLKPIIPDKSTSLHYSIEMNKKENGSILLTVKGTSKDEIHLKAQIYISPD